MGSPFGTSPDETGLACRPMDSMARRGCTALSVCAVRKEGTARHRAELKGSQTQRTCPFCFCSAVHCFAVISITLLWCASLCFCLFLLSQIADMDMLWFFRLDSLRLPCCIDQIHNRIFECSPLHPLPVLRVSMYLKTSPVVSMRQQAVQHCFGQALRSAASPVVHSLTASSVGFRPNA